MNRKEFINRLMRISILGGMVFLTGFLVSRRRVVQGGACKTGTACSKCPALRDCNREEAIKQKENG